MPLDKKLTQKASGDPIASADWNALATETIRLDSDKLNTVGGTVTGLLTAAAGLASPTFGITLLPPDNDTWSFRTDTSAGRAVISRQVEFTVPTTVFALGHGHASTEAGTTATKRAVRTEIKMNGNFLNPVSDSGWGVGYSATPTGTWVPMITLGSVNVPKGRHTFELWLRAIDSPASGAEKYFVNLHGPSLWLARLGTF